MWCLSSPGPCAVQVARPAAFAACRVVVGSSGATSAVAASFRTTSAGSALLTAYRCKSYHFFVNLDDPDATRRRIEEDLDRLASDEKKDTTAYLHSLLNLALSHYQRGDFISARDMADYTHQKALVHNSKSSLIYFTATTCARCAEALAKEYEAHLQRKAEQSHVSAALTPEPSVVFSARRAIKKLRTDAERYRAIAHRVYHRPDMAFMRGSADGGGGRWRSSARHTEGRDTRHTWADNSSNNGVDEEYMPHMYGPRWQDRRKRPEHAEMKHYYKDQCGASPSSRGETRWNVPK
ncbi:conserved hypothetical protein [Leishmania mexicana MHOM/GT/2001/U1103]|uniref:Uncharacterized protein n=1 Tax=Leishmania mexicana (strain MHOM/GT/2001/U1103) TaxID=929439 RepID=E9AS73_LEIMU|nr:conserved hypothetical protein [Leishmania mexicana MHOM/GT/2001/U1103]CBZ25794.1 conserved hypothetical protein [Leishmania mexicana MHOM/GT/2001/U1103]